MSFPFTLPCGQRDFAAGTIVLSIRSKDIKLTMTTADVEDMKDNGNANDNENYSIYKNENDDNSDDGDDDDDDDDYNHDCDRDDYEATNTPT
uniref:Uncharacterized protein n=1 Tax=Glossina morsitans morsitans TaxID=37546 RepID=A0A1B0GF01_GLOMM